MYDTNGRKKLAASFIASTAILIIGVIGAYILLSDRNGSDEAISSTSASVASKSTEEKDAGISDNPLANRTFYTDNSRDITKLAAEYRQAGDDTNAELIEKISSQPGTTWLVGPSESDPDASKDIETVARTSAEASVQGTVPIYQLYAIPGRDACAAYSSGGFQSSEAYLAWIDRIIAALETEAVFSVEADAVAQTIRDNCMSQQQINERYKLLQTTLAKLAESPQVLASYLDAGHSEWFPEPSVLVEPLRKSGVDRASGIAVNVSFFEATPKITAWSQELVGLLGGDKGIIIDTSRNGKGAPAANITGEARWCNPPGRSIGPTPTTRVATTHVDAYFWGKIAGESDGSCFGNPPAGTFEPAAALELAQ